MEVGRWKMEDGCWMLDDKKLKIKTNHENNFSKTSRIFY